jgi:hypothetical protein
MHAKGTGLVVAASHDTALVRAPSHSDRSAQQAGLIASFDGRIEAIAIAVNDLAGL